MTCFFTNLLHAQFDPPKDRTEPRHTREKTCGLWSSSKSARWSLFGSTGHVAQVQLDLLKNWEMSRHSRASTYCPDTILQVSRLATSFWRHLRRRLFTLWDGGVDVQRLQGIWCRTIVSAGTGAVLWWLLVRDFLAPSPLGMGSFMDSVLVFVLVLSPLRGCG